jgi:hypothetical protein
MHHRLRRGWPRRCRQRRRKFLVTGVLGPQSNAHGPNEFLDIETGKKVTACVAQVVAEHYKRK